MVEDKQPNGSTTQHAKWAVRAVDAVQDLIYEADPTGVIVHRNQAFNRIFGYEAPDDVLGMNIRALYVKPAHREIFLRELQAREGVLSDYVVWVNRAGGRHMFLSTDSNWVDGDPEKGVLGTGRDVTLQMRMMGAFYQSNLESNGSPRIFTFVNDGCATMMGYNNPGGMIGKPVAATAYADPGDEEETINSLHAARAERREFAERDIVCKKKDGSIIKVHFSSRFILDARGKLCGIEGSVRDLTELERKVGLRTAELNAAVETRDRFLVTLAHELRTPISKIKATADNLAQGLYRGAEAVKAVQRAAAQVLDLDKMSRRLWRVQQLATKTYDYSDRPVNVYSTLMDCRRLLLDAAAQKKIEIVVDKSISTWPALNFDKEMFEHVVINLLDNAIKYSFPSTTVDVRGGRGFGQTELIFGNVGPEIASEEQEAIFELYRRGKMAERFSPTGSGIGLWLVREFVSRYNGGVDVESRPIARKRYLNMFRVTLPR